MARLNSLKTMSLLDHTFNQELNAIEEGLRSPVVDQNNLILNELRQVVDFKWATIFLYDEVTRRLKIVAQVGDGIDFINRINFSLGNGLSAWVAQKKRLVHLPDIHRGTRHEHHPVRSFISMPLMQGNSVVGVLNLAHVFPNAFGCKELQILENLKEEIVTKIYA
jgi:putative methionine-R-sulfoxide reductase with GAF domain